ncbi:MAG TPA: hypothetical protein VFU49_01060 [Ktedonobacteraceae bacterium]|nr:hypothetical protein [Ktedonobacteraceae bacterium]
MTEQTSQVAQLLQRIEAEYTAAQQGLYGLASVGRHAFLTARQENIAGLHQQLQSVVGQHEAIKLLAETLDTD